MSTVQVVTSKVYDPRKVLDHPEFRVLKSGDQTSKDSNIAAFYNPAHEIHLVEKPKPKPGPGQVLIHVRATGICGSDVHFWKHGRIGDSMIVTDECGSGHESAGEIVEVGEGVTEWKAGDRVAMEVGVPCSQPSCDACRTGRYNGCPDVVFFSTPPYHGTLTRWHVHPAQWLHRLPDNVSFEEGSLCEPLAVALAGIDRAGLRLGDPAVICGAGPIGLVSLLSARAAGAEPIVITDLFQSRLDFAKSLVPGVRTVLIDRNATPKAQAEVIKKAAGGPLKLALECTGVESSIHTAIFSVGFGAKVFIIGVGKNEQLFPFMHLSANEIDVQFQYRYANQYPKAIRLIAGGLINVKPLVTHRFTLEEAVAAFHVAADPAQGAIKVQIQD
ncbi:L-arabinitol 4-dehydrogenase [Lentinula raphanica]|uniref:L-arabinitol 4-dehydrogenase n=1 Tax=Lentinula raphanica TaxID=153919 RepID=A0AA38PBS5_9AGAR|nr:L-arabinitol 4-dehydrogenase [Lentinula raphanica]KAJ3970885.1 L-arabinitol 4-dehydrogenase [Lentinula raphanica]